MQLDYEEKDRSIHCVWLVNLMSLLGSPIYHLHLINYHLLFQN